jgi:signal transduction histidine kinase
MSTEAALYRSGDPVLAPAAEASALTRLEDAARLCGRVGHDFDNVLMGLLGFAELARGRVEPGSQAADYLAELLAVAEGAREITRELHAFSRSGRAHPGPTSLADVCEPDRVISENSLPADIRLDAKLPVDLPRVAVGVEPLRVILGHLIGNAVDAMPGGGAIVVTARTVSAVDGISEALPVPLDAGDYVEMTVADTGRGMNPDFAERAGRVPFVTTKVRHRGLGLPTVLRTLSAHGGGLRIESSTRGTAVVVYLPSAEEFPSAPADLCRGAAPLEVAPP